MGIHKRSFPGTDFEPKTFVELLRWRAENQTEKKIYTYLLFDGNEDIKMTLGDVDRKARAVGAWLQSMKMEGERALLLYPPGMDYIISFLGCLYAGVVAVPAYPPEPSRLEKTLPRIQAIVKDAQAKIALTTQEIMPMLDGLELGTMITPVEKGGQVAGNSGFLKCYAVESIDDAHADDWKQPAINQDSLAFLQYTSGSTGVPKGVMLSHENLLTNSALINQGFRFSQDAEGVIWLPIYHDMGLIGGVLQPLYAGIHCTLMSPISFLKRPMRWMQTISDITDKLVVSGGPNFAYDLCSLKNLSDEQKASLDLSNWHTAFSGAEPVRPQTIDRFFDIYKDCGFRKEAFFPVYGLAEATLFVSGGIPTDAPKVIHIKKSSLEKNIIEDAAPTDEDAQIFVGCGHEQGDHHIVIANPETRTKCQPGEIGEIWESGGSVARGYWNRPELSKETFQAHLSDTGEGPFLRTGDLGFIKDGELFITGRAKDLIIIRGRNHYPQDIELTVEESHPKLRKGSVAVFSVEADGDERLVVVQEVRTPKIPNPAEIFEAIQLAIVEAHELQVWAIVLIKPRTIAKTSSGKIARHSSKKDFLANQLPVVAEWQATTGAKPTGAKKEELAVTPATEPARPTPALNSVQNWLVSRLAELTQLDLAEIDIDKPFANFGLDSARVVGLTGELEEWLERELNPTLIWDYPTIRQLASHLVGEVTELRTGIHTSRPSGNDTEPIAIVGIGCRFPGANNPAEFWNLLKNGIDGISEVPADRWDADTYYDPEPDQPGKMITRSGGFVDQIDQFDPHFFGISPREATRMDPQQRLALEVVWEALENAGIPPQQLAGSDTGVFFGISNGDFSIPQYLNTKIIDPYTGTGNAFSISANRISYVLDVHGPSVALDTACSSSLVGIHLAAQSLRSGESGMAIAGGVNLIISPELTITFSQAHMMSPEGRSKTFDASADGYVRGEGCGVVILKRLSDAQRDGDRILALIHGSAVNQDGRSNGITAPNGKAQQAVIHKALENARLQAQDIDYIETHGTGTILGDPIEANALVEVMRGRPASNPCLIGSVKANIGHLESAAGVAGFIKVVLALKNQEIPPLLHFQKLNPRIQIPKSELKVASELQPWPASKKGRLAGVSSFGFGGTNAHIVLGEAPAAEISPVPVERTRHIFTLSAKSEKALNSLVERSTKYLSENSALPPGDVCFTTNTGRNHFSSRLAVIAENTANLETKLEHYLNGDAVAGLTVTGRIPKNRGKLAFLFTGQGPQYVDMAKVLYGTQPTFKQTVDRCAQILEQYLEHSILDVIFENGTTKGLIHETQYTQPALFTIEYALAELWRGWGIEPDYVLGHSVGEYVAACFAGFFSLEDGLKLITARGKLMQALPQKGEMVVVFAPMEQVQEFIAPHLADISIAAVNGPTSIVISGKREAIQMVVARLTDSGINTRPLTVSHAFHSPLMAPILDEFEKVAAEIKTEMPRLPLVSNLTGKILGPWEMPDAQYWRKHIREAVQFNDGMKLLESEGCEIFIEIGPNPILLGMGIRCVPELAAKWLPSLKKDQDDWEILLGSLASLYTLGFDIDWKKFDANYKRQRVDLPSYPFQRIRCWQDEVWENSARAARAADLARKNGALHPLLKKKIVSPVLQHTVFEAIFDVRSLPLLDDHRVFDIPVFPGVGYLEMALAGGRQFWGQTEIVIENAEILEPMSFMDNEHRSVQLILEPKESNSVDFQIFSQTEIDAESEAEWKLHARGTLRQSASEATEPVELEKLKQRFESEIEIDSFYNQVRERGIEYGPRFRGIGQLKYHGNEVLGRVSLPELIENELDDYLLHPSLLDASFQLLGGVLAESDTAGDGVYLPVGVEKLHFLQSPTRTLWSHIVVHSEMTDGADFLTATIQLYNDQGQLVAEVKNAQFKHANLQAFSQLSKPKLNEWIYQLEWQEKELSDNLPTNGSAAGNWLVFSDETESVDELARSIEKNGGCTVIVPGEKVEKVAENRWELDFLQPDQLQQLFENLKQEELFPLAGIIYFCENKVAGDLTGAVGPMTSRILHLVQMITAANLTKPPQLWLVTRGAQLVTENDTLTDLPAGTIWGLGRVIALEHPELDCRRIDLAEEAAENEAQLLVNEILASDREDQIAYREGKRFVARLMRGLPKQQNNQLKIPENQSFRLDIPQRGVLENLKIVPVNDDHPAANQVKIKVRATGLNFRDVLNALDLYPGDPGPLGGECAGEVIEIGAEVTHLKIGDPVLAIASGSFGSHVITYGDLAIRKPDNLSFEAAATIPITFLTAHYALNRLAKISSTDRVLIHTASGGVGLAAIQLAQLAGAEIFGTAGNPEKRAFLKNLGIPHIMNSRTLDFADEILESTGGKGVSIVLNSLSGDYIPRNLSVIDERGCFLEIGKVGIWAPEKIAEVKPNLAYHTIALDDMSRDNPALIQEMFRELMPLFESGKLRPLHHRIFPLEWVVQAFRFMAQAKHIGKVIISQNENSGIRPDAAYLITGGLGALGLLISRWLVAQGARHLVLSDLGTGSEKAKEQVQELLDAGVSVHVLPGNIARSEDVTALFAQIQELAVPLRGIIHLAGVLDDGVLTQQSRERFEKVLAPKVAGSWYLHENSKTLELDFFVTFSSIAALFGSPGQGNYAAANAFMDSLARYRSQQNLPALSINWGPWGQVGMAASLDRPDQQRQAGNGVNQIDPENGLFILEKLLHEKVSQVGAFSINWPVFFRQFPAGMEPVFLSALKQKLQPVQEKSADNSHVLKELEAAAPEKRKELLTNHLRTEAIKILGLDADYPLDPKQPLSEMGLDSLMAIEMKNALSSMVGQNLPATLLFNYPTIAGLAGHLVDDLFPTENHPSAESEEATETEEDIENLSDDEVEAMLSQKLAELGNLNDEDDK